MAQSSVRNVLFITADQWRGDTLGAVGHPCIKTPNLDRLAADGVLFSKHYSQGSPCSPARASLLTGLYLFNHRVVYNGTPLDRRFTNVALEARKAGYDPVLIGYTSTAPDPRTLEPGDPRLCQRRSKSTPLAGVKMHHLMRFSPALAVVPAVHRRDPRCFV